MKKLLFIFSVLCTLFLTGCISGERMVRNSPFDGNKFYRNGVNLFPLYYKEGNNQSILFPMIDIDDRGFAVRPFYHKDKDEHGILWPLCAFNKKDGWVGTYFWNGSRTFGLLPLFVKDHEFLWVFPLSWFSKEEDTYAILPLFCKNKDFLWVGNVLKTDDMFLVLPIYGQGKDWFYLLNFVYAADAKRQESNYVFIPLAYFQKLDKYNTLLTPLFSFETYDGDLQMFNFAIFLYHYSHGQHHVFYPFADIDFKAKYQEAWVWPLFNYGMNRSNSVPFFLFDYTDMDSSKYNHTTRFDEQNIRILYPLLFNYNYQKNTLTSTTEILPFGALWYDKSSPDEFDQRILFGALFRNSKDQDSRRFSLLYKFFSYHRFKDNVKWEFFPFIKIMDTPQNSSWSFCWRLLEKHDGGGHIFFIPWGEPQAKTEVQSGE